MEPNKLVQRLDAVVPLDETDKVELLSLCNERVEAISSKRDVAGLAAARGCIYVMLEGWAARYTVLANGTRQITGLLLPGDISDFGGAVRDNRSHRIASLTSCKVACIDPAKFDALLQKSDTLATAVSGLDAIHKAILREWIVNSRRTALAAVSHLLCEIHQRLSEVGLVSNGRFGFPLSQENLGEATGITAVHTNRIIQSLRKSNLIELRGRRVSVLDRAGLIAAGEFADDYLTLRLMREG